MFVSQSNSLFCWLDSCDICTIAGITIVKRPNRISAIFEPLIDHRVERTKLHSMESIIFISMASVIAGADTWDKVVTFGEAKIDWIENHVDLLNGIPSASTFNRFFSCMNPDVFEECFRQWVATIVHKFDGDVISIDGKTIRGTRAFDESPLHIVSAWSVENKISLGQVRTDEKSNEITAIPELLHSLFIDDAIVTIDAMGCQTEIEKLIIGKNADYVLAVKKNHPKLYDDIEDSFKMLPADSHIQTENFDHGRIERRRYSVISDLSLIDSEILAKWPGLNCIVKVESNRHIKVSGAEDSATRYYISSLAPDARRIAHAIRSHWGIEINLHWSLDVSFDEDNTRKRNRYAVMNWSVVNKIALAILQKDQSSGSISTKRFKAAVDNDYLNNLMHLA